MDGTALRIIDANANRAREALRVLEDAARFGLDRADLCAQLKAARHDLAAALAQLPADETARQAWRDTPGDVGTAITADAERSRAGMRGVVVAAGKRLGESLRAIEECAKALGEDGARAAVIIERVRYGAYDAERSLVLAMGADRRAGWRLCVLITEALCAQPWEEVARAGLAGGADCVQLREKHLTDRELLSRATRLVAIAREHAVSNDGVRPAIIINDRPDIAMLARADGVHLGQGDMSIADVRRLAGASLLVGVSTANVEQASAAVEAGADYCGVGPMFETTTKHKPVLAGPGYLRAYLETCGRVPCLAIGGVNAQNATELRAASGCDALAPSAIGGIDANAGVAGTWGVAVSSAVCGSDDPEAACRAIIGAVSSAGSAAGATNAATS
jgi:thiamine-phosphate pyrophosphorylase